MVPPRNPSSTDDTSSDEAPRLLEDIDKMSPEDLADYLYALAEEIISSPLEYKMKMGLTQLDISEFDKIDLSTPAGRRKLAKLFRLLAQQVLKGKQHYLSSVVDKSAPNQTRGR